LRDWERERDMEEREAIMAMRNKEREENKAEAHDDTFPDAAACSISKVVSVVHNSSV
jgi:hypothetical protein